MIFFSSIICSEFNILTQQKFNIISILIINQIKFEKFNQQLINHKMKITVKTLKGEMMQIDVELVTTVMQLKHKIKQLKGFEIEGQKIVYKGKATQNQDTIEKLNIKQKDFLVVMSTVKKPQSKKQQKKVQQKTEQKVQENKQIKPQTKPEVKPQVNNGQDQHKINELMSMGFPREQCIQALRAAFGNSEVAVQYIFNGIPADLGGNQPASQTQSAVNPLSSMLGGAQFNQLRQLLRSDPSAIGPILQHLAQTSPQLYNMITLHPEEFEQLLMDDGEYQGEESIQPEEGSIVVTQEEQQAIQRLAMLGFTKIEAAQAYMACDKNQQMAANLLFDRLANGDIQGGFEEDFQDQDQHGDEDDDNLFN